MKSDGAIEFSVLELSGGGEGTVGIVTLVTAVLFASKVRSDRAG